jgi:hypothetical protein
MTQTKAHRGSGRRKMSVAQNLNTQQQKLGLNQGGQCLPSLERNTGIEPEINLHAAVLVQIKQIYCQKFISEQMAIEARMTANLIEKRGYQMLYGKEFLKTARGIAILSFQKDGYKAFGLFFKSELNNEI